MTALTVTPDPDFPNRLVVTRGDTRIGLISTDISNGRILYSAWTPNGYVGSYDTTEEAAAALDAISPVKDQAGVGQPTVPGFCGACGATFTERSALDAHQLETRHEMDQPDHPLRTPEPMTTDRLAAIEAAILSPAGATLTDMRDLLAEARRARTDADDQHTEADYWREGYRLTKGLSSDEINAITAARDAARPHPRPCRFPHEPCLCND